MGRVEVYTGFRWGNQRERDHLEDLGVDGRMDLQEMRCEGMDWIDVAQDWDKRRALVNAVRNHPIP
jgi:hypothetical protein